MINIEFLQKGNIKIVKLVGKLTSESVDIFKKTFEDSRSAHNLYILDFEKLEFIDSVGLGFLIHILKEFINEGGALKIINLKEQPMLIFEITRVKSVFDIYENEEEALKSFKGMEIDDESSNIHRQTSL